MGTTIARGLLDAGLLQRRQVWAGAKTQATCDEVARALEIETATDYRDFLPDAGIVTFEDAETGDQIEVDTGDPSVRAAYAHLAQRRWQELEHQFRRDRIDFVPIRTDRDYLPALRTFFRTRERRAR